MLEEAALPFKWVKFPQTKAFYYINYCLALAILLCTAQLKVQQLTCSLQSLHLKQMPRDWENILYYR